MPGARQHSSLAQVWMKISLPCGCSWAPCAVSNTTAAASAGSLSRVSAVISAASMTAPGGAGWLRSAS